MIPLVLGFFAPFAYDQYTLSKVAMAAVLVAVCGWLRGFERKHLSVSLLALFGAFALSAAFSGDFLVNLTGRYCSRYLGLIPLVLCLLAYHLPTSLDSLSRQMRISAALLSLYGLSQLVYNPWGYDVLSTGNRIIGSMGSPPALGCVLAMCLPFCYGKTPARAVLTALTMAALLATGSRGPILAAAIASAFVIIPQDRNGAKLAAMLLGVAFIAAITFNHGVSDQLRMLTWTSAVKVWWTAPWIGVGAESYVDTWRLFRDNAWVSLVGVQTFQDHAHNDFLHVLAATGVVGFALYLGFLCRAWRHLRSWADLEGVRPILASMVALFICAKFNAVPFAALFVAALLLGTLDAPPLRVNWPTEWPLTLFSGVLAAACVWAFAADVLFYRARRVLDFPGIMRAAALNPLELHYQAHQADLLARQWFLEPQNTDLLVRALLISRDALNLHPISVQARHMVTQNLVFLARVDPVYIVAAQTSAEVLLARDPRLNFRFKVVKYPQQTH